MKNLKKVLSLVFILTGLCSHAYSASDFDVSRALIIDNKNAVKFTSIINNWDGTVEVNWHPEGGYKLIRKNMETGEQTGWSAYGKSFTDSFELSQLQTGYKYYLLNTSDTSIDDAIAVSEEIIPEIIVVLVRGYDAKPVGDAINPNYWNSDSSEQNKGLVPSVKGWFESKKITCWDSSSDLNGTKGIQWNANKLADYLSDKLASDERYNDAKFFLFGHSMGGLHSRQFANNNPDRVLKIFCAQTPHTGSPAAFLYAFWPKNEATKDLTTERLKVFNDAVVLDIPIYSTYSTDYVEAMDSVSLKTGAGMLLAGGWLNHSIYSDGIVPVNSAKGTLYEKIIFEKEKVKIAVKFDSSLDHSSCYRHERVLNKVIEWLGYSSVESLAAGKLSFDEGPTEQADPQYFVAGFNGAFDSATPVQETVLLSGSNKCTFQAYGTDATASYTCSLIDPLGRTITSTTSDPNISYVYEDGYMIYSINEPQPGYWQVDLATTTANEQQYGISVFEDSYVSFSITPEKQWISTGQTLLLTAEVVDNIGAVTGASVTAVVTLPNETTQNITLYDDGTNGDLDSGDGTYSCNFTSTALTGAYSVEASATGAAAAGDFERSSFTSFSISEATIAFDGNILDQGIDSNDNGYYEVLRFNVPVTVNSAGDFRLTANLVDAASETIDIVNSGRLTLAADANNISVEVPASEIVDHGADGPYTLIGIEITDPNSGITIADTADYTSAAYTVMQFEPKDTDGDGLSDILEQSIGTLINKADSDEDGATDFEEVALDNDANSYDSLNDANPLVVDTDSDTMTDGYEIAYGLNPLVDDSLGDLDGDGLDNKYEYDNHLRADRIDTDDDGRNDKWEIDNGYDPLVYEQHDKVIADINLDAVVDVLDVANMAKQWLSQPTAPGADIAPGDGDEFVDMLDFATLAENWDTGL